MTFSSLLHGWIHNHDKDHNTNDIDKIKWLIARFQILLKTSNFDESKWYVESCLLHYCLQNLKQQSYGKIFTYRKKEFSNILKIVEQVLCLSSSDNVVERSFSILTTKWLLYYHFSWNFGRQHDYLFHCESLDWARKRRNSMKCYKEVSNR